MAKKATDLSKVDQENLMLKIKEWEKANPRPLFYYRPVGKNMGVGENCKEGEQTFLYVHQEEWQKELLSTYGNTITLMDATYKTTK